MRFKVVSLAALCCAILAAQPQVGPVPPQPPAPTDGPTELIITYRCPPPHRAAFRQFISENGILRFEHWKQDGMLKEYRFLFNWYVDVDSWDAMVVLSFSSYAQVARWKLVEHASPGGLIRDALEMAWPLNTTPADLIMQGESDQPWNSANSVFVAGALRCARAGEFSRFCQHDSGAAVKSVDARRQPGRAIAYIAIVTPAANAGRECCCWNITTWMHSVTHTRCPKIAG